MLQKWLGEDALGKLFVWLDRVQKNGTTFSAADFLDYMSSEARKQWVMSIGKQVQEVVSPGWNNTPRYGNRFTALECLTPESFAALVGDALSNAVLPPLVNAWNEWSEGAAIEPCAYFGTRYLDALDANRAKLK
ncbi:MAG: glycoside hydrolase family 99-like domain-containing protein [Steroidobacteraceae bacterium]